MRKYHGWVLENKAIFVGVDVHVKQWHVTIRTEEAELFTGSIPGTWNALCQMLQRYRPEQTLVVYEAGYFGYTLHDAVLQWGGQAVVTPPSLVPMEYGNRVKTDKRDSRKLAWLLSCGLLRANWVPDSQLRCHRQVLRRRCQLLGDRVRLQSRIKAELAFYGIDISGRKGRWSKRWVDGLWHLSLPDSFAQASFQQLLEGYRQICDQVAEQTRLLRELSCHERYRKPYEWLTSIPGVGLITGMTILLELGDMTRFSHTDRLAAYVGLTPAQYSSGEHVRLGRITRVGKHYLRGLLIEASWIAIRRDPELAAVYQRTLPRAGSKRAIVAVARRLLLRCRRVLLDGRSYVVSPAT
jgi:transposase